MQPHDLADDHRAGLGSRSRRAGARRSCQRQRTRRMPASPHRIGPPPASTRSNRGRSAGGDRSDPPQPHQHDDRRALRRQALEDRPVGLLGMTRDHDEPGGHAAMGHRDAGQRRRGDRRADARNHLEGMPAAASASASSPPRPNTNGSPPFSRTTRRPRRAARTMQPADELLAAPPGGRRACRRTFAAPTAPDRASPDPRARRRTPGPPRPAAGPPARQQIRIAGTRAHQRDETAPGRDWWPRFGIDRTARRATASSRRLVAYSATSASRSSGRRSAIGTPRASHSRRASRAHAIHARGRPAGALERFPHQPGQRRRLPVG